MEHNTALGIHISETGATAAHISRHGSKIVLLNSFSVSRTAFGDSVQGDDENIEPVEKNQNVIEAIAEQCKARSIPVNNVSVGLHCSLFTQHDVHSQFSDQRQVQQTIKFDAEESIATDVLQKAVTFNIKKVDATGSDVTVFAADLSKLKDMLSEFQSSRIDPLAMEPDSSCLTRFLVHCGRDFTAENLPLCIFVSEKVCYMIRPSAGRMPARVRTFLISAGQDKTKLLTRQIPMTLAGMGDDVSIDNILLLDDTNSVRDEELMEVAGMRVQSLDIDNVVESQGEESAAGSDVNLAIACGAGLGCLTRGERNDFRQDFMPYRGRRAIIETTVKAMSVCVTIMLVAFGIYFQLEHWRMSRNLDRLHDKLAKQYKMVVAGSRIGPRDNVIAKLEREIRRVKDRKQGKLSMLGDETTAAKLTYVLEALTEAPKSVDFNIETISISEKVIRIQGDTNNRRSTLQLFGQFNKHPKLKKGPATFKPSGGRDTFRLSLEPTSSEVAIN